MVESSRCDIYDGPDGHNSYDGYDGYYSYHMVKSAQWNLLNGIQRLRWP